MPYNLVADGGSLAPLLTMFTFSQRLGIFLTIEGAFFSVVAVTSVLCFVVYKWLRKTLLTWGKNHVLSADATDSSLFRNLMLADLLQAVANFPNIRWLQDAEIIEGHLCTAQAAMKQVGIVAVAMTSLAISVQTFSVLVLRWRPPRHMSKFAVLGVWVFTALDIGISNATKRHVRYYGDSGFWCWIVDKYPAERVVTEYLWVWISVLATIILYGIMFIMMRGWFVIDHGIHWHKSYRPSGLDVEPMTEGDKVNKAIANLMLFYPAVSLVCVLPNSISRWRVFAGLNTPDSVTFFAETLFNLSGMWNALLFYWTRPELVKGPSIVIEAEDSPHQHHSNTSSGPPTTKLGRLPERTYPDGSPIGEKWRDEPDFSPGTLLPDRGLYASEPHNTFDSSPGRFTHNRKGSHLSDRDYRSSKESSSPIDGEEDYGRLPGS